MKDPKVDVETLYHELNENLFEGSLPADYRIEFVPVTELSPDDGEEGGDHDGASRTIKLTDNNVNDVPLSFEGFISGLPDLICIRVGRGFVRSTTRTGSIKS